MQENGQNKFRTIVSEVLFIVGNPACKNNSQENFGHWLHNTKNIFITITVKKLWIEIHEKRPPPE